jgi:tetratricopeptide (TPR) repeat protein
LGLIPATLVLCLNYYKKILKIDPENYDALNGLGHAYALKGDYDNAIKIFELAKGKKPSMPGAYNKLGNVYDSKAELEKALNEYKAAQKVAPKDQESYKNIAAQKLAKGVITRTMLKDITILAIFTLKPGITAKQRKNSIKQSV